MASIENTTIRKPGKSAGFHKKSTRVDLTPMVDLGFLLITFFVFTTSLQQPTVMNLRMPNDKTISEDPVCSSCALTLILQDDSKIIYYEGMPTASTSIRQTGFDPEGIRQVILQKKKELQALRGKADDLVLIIKPSAESSFENFVDILDEVTINNVKRYYLDELTPADKLFLSKK